MIIWIRERKGWVGVVFCVMIGIFAASFVIGGVGSGNNASLSDIFNNNGSGSASTTPTASSVGSLEKKVKAQPNNAALWTDLANAYASASQPGDEARAWAKVDALKPSNMTTLQRLALAQAQVATNNSNQAQQLQQSGLSQAPGDDSTFAGGTLGGAAVADENVGRNLFIHQQLAPTRRVCGAIHVGIHFHREADLHVAKWKQPSVLSLYVPSSFFLPFLFL